MDMDKCHGTVKYAAVDSQHLKKKTVELHPRAMMNLPLCLTHRCIAVWWQHHCQDAYAEATERDGKPWTKCGLCIIAKGGEGLGWNIHFPLALIPRATKS